MSEGLDDVKFKLNLEITSAIAKCNLPWPEYGHVIAKALTEIVGNPISVRIRADRVVHEV